MVHPYRPVFDNINQFHFEHPKLLHDLIILIKQKECSKIFHFKSSLGSNNYNQMSNKSHHSKQANSLQAKQLSQ